ncbi:hypothetical protein NQ317_004141 [Molorchus minor]|uniref:Uncharacterized protein n=1 Tax=Molorchus minor TaxID=1323400 RepID=A0ABQ9J539_9CUCU|nr:hypothetical protein NQ317_004141 [Molorchus minor]
MLEKVYHTTMESVTCASCVGMLISYVNFTTSCKNTEEKINLYREVQQDKGLIKLSNILPFLREALAYNNVNVKEELELLDSREKCKQKR